MSTRRQKQEAVPSLIHVMARVSRALKGSMQVVLEGHGVHAGQNFILEQWREAMEISVRGKASGKLLLLPTAP